MLRTITTGWMVLLLGIMTPTLLRHCGITVMNSSSSAAAAAATAFSIVSNKRNATTTMMMKNKMMMLQSSSLVTFHELDSVDSTQDEAKRLLGSTTTTTTTTTTPYLAVLARHQTNGRGTSGRKWISSTSSSGSSSSSSSKSDGNLFLTVAIPSHKIPIQQITLLPLYVGILIAKILSQIIHDYHHHHDHDDDLCSSSNDNNDNNTTCSTSSRSSSKVTLKWPNDVLINDEKIAGVLIESYTTTTSSSTTTTTGTTKQNNHDEMYYFLVGIGINVAHAPTIHPSQGRPATCLQQHIIGKNDDDNGNGSSLLLPESTCIDIAQSLVEQLIQWTEHQNHHDHNNNDENINVVEQWKEWVEFGQTYTIRDTNQVVVVLDIEANGQLRVRDVSTGRERLLIADYLY